VSKERIPLAKEERRTKSELFREMFHVYQRYRRQHERDEERWGMDLIREAKEDTKRKVKNRFAQLFLFFLPPPTCGKCTVHAFHYQSELTKEVSYVRGQQSPHPPVS
jgi:hypothetical protein